MKNSRYLILYIIAVILLYPICAYILRANFELVLSEVPFEIWTRVLLSAPGLIIIGLLLLYKQHKKFHIAFGMIFGGVGLYWFCLLLWEMYLETH